MRQRVFFAWALLGLVIVAAVVIWGRSHNAQAALDAPMMQSEMAPVTRARRCRQFSGTTLDRIHRLPTRR